MSFPPVAAAPYAWPFDGAWSRADTVLLVVDAYVGAPLPPAAAGVLAAARAAGLRRILTAQGEAELAFPAGEDEPIVRRAAVNAFLGSDLGHLLARARARNLVFIGQPAEGAVHATMRAASDHGFEGLAIEDALGTGAAEDLAAILRITRFGNGLFGTTATAAAFLAALGATA
jgi:nicotinamidase-related amidase